MEFSEGLVFERFYHKKNYQSSCLVIISLSLIFFELDKFLIKFIQALSKIPYLGNL